jgi:(p)ppGpp synthase/HD superfamily hydrolase
LNFHFWVFIKDVLASKECLCIHNYSLCNWKSFISLGKYHRKHKVFHSKLSERRKLSRKNSHAISDKRWDEKKFTNKFPHRIHIEFNHYSTAPNGITSQKKTRKRNIIKLWIKVNGLENFIIVTFIIFNFAKKENWKRKLFSALLIYF